VAEPRAVADPHRTLRLPLHRDRPVEVLIAVVLVGDVDVMARPDVVADLDREVPDNPAAPPDQASVADPHDGVGEATLARRHPGRQRHVRADDRPVPDVDVALVDDGRRRKADHAAVAEPPEPPAAAAPGPDRPELAHDVPAPEHELTRTPSERTRDAGRQRVRQRSAAQHGGARYPRATMAR
jgi:hypothetical protein